MQSVGGLYVLLLAVTIVVCGLALSYDYHRWRHLRRQNMIEFQRTMGGIGMGAISTPLWNMLNYDPRVQPVDDSNLWPIPGSYPYSPVGVSVVTLFLETPSEDLVIMMKPAD